MMLQEFLRDYKDSPIAHAIVSGAITFVIAFTLDMLFSYLYSLINDYRRKPVPLPEKIARISTKKVPNYKKTLNKSSRKVTYEVYDVYDDGNRGKKYNYIKEP